MLEGKRILVAGASNHTGLGYAIASALVEQGSEVVVTCRQESNDRAVKWLGKVGIRPIVCDPLIPDSLNRLAGVVGEAGPLDGIVHSIASANPAGLQGSFLDSINPEDFTLAMNASVYTFLGLVKGLSPILRDGASVVTLTYMGSQRPVPHYNLMGLAKAALQGAVRAFALDLGPRNIRVNAISSPFLPTASSRAIADATKMKDLQKANSLLAHQVTKEDVANTAVYLLSDLSSSVTGQVIKVDGGFSHSICSRDEAS